MENWHEHIDNYMNGSLDADLKNLFEEELRNNTELQAGIKNYKAAKLVSEGLLELDILNTLSNLQQREQNQLKRSEDENHSPDLKRQSSNNTYHPANGAVKEQVIFWNFRKLLSAAVFFGVLFVAGFYLLSNNQDDQRRAYVLAQIDDMKPIDEDATKSIDTMGMTLFEKGKYYYALNRFDESAQWLKLATTTTKDNKDMETYSKIYYWLGHAHIQLWEVEEAKRAWKQSGEVEAEILIQTITAE